MSSKMKITGVAPLIAIPTFIYLIIAIIISYSSDNQFNILNHDKIAVVVLRVILILIGIIMVAHCGRKLLSSHKKDKLMTDGLYKIFRDPMYAAYLVFCNSKNCICF
jgi:protein-S-isoprenylcysteine O-methyltransferase Ste14